LEVVAWAASTCLEAAAAAADRGRETSDAGLIVRARALADRVLPEAEGHVAQSTVGPELGVRREADLSLATARAHAQRVRGRIEPGTWDALATAWGRCSMPYREATARWWQALTILANEEDREGARAAARAPLAQAYRIASDLPAMPLLREVIDLATRARVALPTRAGSNGHAQPTSPGGLVAVGPGIRADKVAVGPGRSLAHASGPASGRPDVARAIEERVIASLRRGPVEAYRLSPREHEVLHILADGRTDRDIAARLFISERTVHVHVRRILAKLGVSSRTEAAGLAIRKGLVPAQLPEPAEVTPPRSRANR
jgi:DNA-binding CsgD family transcriptional regulator